jgi:hypothetical protein
MEIKQSRVKPEFVPVSIILETELDVKLMVRLAQEARQQTASKSIDEMAEKIIAFIEEDYRSVI